MTSPKVLVVEDDARIRSELLETLRAEGFETQVAVSCAAAMGALQEHFDLVLLDVGLGDGDGLDICRTLRREGRSVPIIVLSGHDAPEDRVTGLDAGADDYVIKPFHTPEVMARIRTVLRRAGRPLGTGVVRHRDLWVDLSRVIAGRGDETLKLKPREFEFLAFLIGHPGRAWTRAQLIDRVWGHGYMGDERTVDLHVRRLRAKIERDGDSDRYIETVWGIGYRLADDPAFARQRGAAG